MLPSPVCSILQRSIQMQKRSDAGSAYLVREIERILLGEARRLLLLVCVGPQLAVVLVLWQHDRQTCYSVCCNGQAPFGLSLCIKHTVARLLYRGQPAGAASDRAAHYAVSQCPANSGASERPPSGRRPRWRCRRCPGRPRRSPWPPASRGPQPRCRGATPAPPPPAAPEHAMSERRSEQHLKLVQLHRQVRAWGAEHVHANMLQLDSHSKRVAVRGLVITGNSRGGPPRLPPAPLHPHRPRCCRRPRHPGSTPPGMRKCPWAAAAPLPAAAAHAPPHPIPADVHIAGWVARYVRVWHVGTKHRAFQIPRQCQGAQDDPCLVPCVRRLCCNPKVSQASSRLQSALHTSAVGQVCSPARGSGTFSRSSDSRRCGSATSSTGWSPPLASISSTPAVQRNSGLATAVAVPLCTFPLDERSVVTHYATAGLKTPPRTHATRITDVLATCGSRARLAGCGPHGLRRRRAVNLLDLEVASARQVQQLVGRQPALPDVGAATTNTR